MKECVFERKIGRKTYRIIGELVDRTPKIRVYVEKPVKLKGQEVHSGFFFAQEWLEFQRYAEALLRGAA